MFNIGDMVVYGINGVFNIDDIREESVLGNSVNYYVLQPLTDRNASLVFVPVANEALTAEMRPIVSKDRANAIILSIPTVAPAEWCEDNRRRQEGFKATIKSGDHTALIAMIKSIIEFGKRRLAIGKKNYLVDENVMKKAEKLLASEFSLAMGEEESEVAQRIEAQL